MARSHKDVEFHVESARGQQPPGSPFKSFDAAAGMAVAIAASGGGEVYIDVVIWTKAGARAYGGDYGVEQYEEDPEASVFERVVVRADSQGRIP